MKAVNPLVRQLERLEEQPMMMINHDERYIILYDTEENIQKFKNYTKDANQEFLDQFKYYYNTPDDYLKIREGIELISKLNAERERQRKLENPPISEEIKNISNRDELIEYLLSERYAAEFDLLYERAMDMELDEAILNAEQEELKRLADKYI